MVSSKHDCVIACSGNGAQSVHSVLKGTGKKGVDTKWNLLGSLKIGNEEKYQCKIVTL